MSLDDLIAAECDAYVEDAAFEARDAYRRAVDLSESPLEALLLVRMLRDGWLLEPVVLSRGLLPLWESAWFEIRRAPGFDGAANLKEKSMLLHPDGYVAKPQARATLEGSSYRFDFLVSAPSGEFFVLELDGHDYHERTREQARRDRARDRACVRAGYRVLRFTGQEIHEDVAACLHEAVATMRVVGDDEGAPPPREETRQ